jgi:hypothetical protein
MDNWGRFPFGQPNTARPARMASRSEAAIVGVYPSAWHVAWTAPPGLASPGIKGAVAALAVDVEPTVFWDGSADDFAQRLEGWRQAVGFVEERHGAIGSRSPSTNGSSGKKVVERYLAPLGIGAERATYTDVFPVFQVKSSGGARREQGDAIRDEYDSVAARLGAPPCSLRARIPKSKLPAVAASTFGERLVADLAESEAPLIITLGDEVWATLLAIPSLRARPPANSFSDLYGERYGVLGSLMVRGREVAWLPMVHPGLLKGTGDVDTVIDPRTRSVQGWSALHARWAMSAIHRRST